MRWVPPALCLAACLLSAAPALAHPLLDEARAASERADFPAALDALSRLDAADDLSIEELPDFLMTRATVRFALGQQAEMVRDLEALATIAPGYAMSETVAPAIRSSFDRARARAAPLAIDATARTVPGGIEIRVATPEHARALVRAVRIHTRAAGGDWLRADGPTMLVPVPAGARIEYWVVAVGPGNTHVTSSGSPAAPHEARAEPATSPRRSAERDETAAPAAAVADDPGSGGGVAWQLIVGGALVLIAGAIVAVVVLTGSDESGAPTQFDAPTVSGWP